MTVITYQCYNLPGGREGGGNGRGKSLGGSRDGKGGYSGVSIGVCVLLPSVSSVGILVFPKNAKVEKM